MLSLGGIWVRLEAEWRENNSLPGQSKLKTIYNGKQKIKALKLL